MSVINNSSCQLALSENNNNSNKLFKSLKKLSSGMKLNNAGDSAADYSISEKMRSMIRSLNQCNINVNTGINMLNIASQAVNQQIDIVKELRKLALKSANSTQTDSDRVCIQKEVSQLREHLDTIAYDTKYNKINLLTGSTNKNVTVTTTVPITTPPSTSSSTGTTTITKITYVPSDTYKKNTLNNLIPAANDTSYSGIKGYAPKYDYTIGSNIFIMDFKNLKNSQGKNPTIDDFNNQGFTILCEHCPLSVVIHLTDKFTPSDSIRYDVSPEYEDGQCYYELGIKDCNPSDIAQVIFDGINAANANYPRSDKKYTINTIGTRHGQCVVDKFNPTSVKKYSTRKEWIKIPAIAAGELIPPMVIYPGVIGELKKETITIEDSSIGGQTSTGGQTSINLFSTINKNLPYMDKYLQTHTKSSQNNLIRLYNTTNSALFPLSNSRFDLEPALSDYPKEYSDDIDKMTEWRENIWKYANKKNNSNDYNVLTIENAINFLYGTDQALKYLLYVNTTLGSDIERLNATINNLTVEHENINFAESILRDADIAQEITEYTKKNVLMQATQYMLSQANQSAVNVISLLK